MAEINPRELKGLTQEQAAALLKTHGYNELPASKPKSILRIAFDVVKEPMFMLLVACGLLYLFLGDLQEAIMLLFFVFVVMGITFYQEKKTERALEALRDLSSPRALVIRDGASVRIAGREVVPGDIVILSEGDRVPADGVVIWDSNITVDESLLTGESAPVRKSAGDASAAMGRPGGDDTPFMYSGTMVVQGQAVAAVKNTGMTTELGKIGRAINAAPDDSTFLQKEINNLVKVIAFIGLVLCAAVFLVYGYTRQDFTGGFLAGLSLAMAMLPEEFPVVMTIFFALGAWRMSRKRVLTRRVAAIETLGSATVLCVDKTGTLTQNRMAVKQVYAGGQVVTLETGMVPEAAAKVIEYGILSCRKDPFDPMEKAFVTLVPMLPHGTDRAYDTHEFIKEYPLSKKMLALSHVWKAPAGGGCVVACKGAPEAVMDLCHMDDAQRGRVMAAVNAMASQGLRILGVAGATFGNDALPGNQHDFSFEFLGLTGLADPVRPEVPGSIRECYDAGIRVVMITGDYPGTARSIAREIGLKNRDEVITGEELESMAPEELKKRVKDVNVFARVVPEQKLKLVQAFKDSGEVTAMTGDGVNDAPALKNSHIGIAMGGRGTDVARESAALVLLDDDFTSIVTAVRMGRRIFDNIKKALAYIVSVHIPIAGLSLLPVFLKWPLILTPVHIVFLELIIDPACSTVFEAEPEEKDVMKRAPRGMGAKVFDWRSMGLAITQGFIVLAVILAVYIITGKVNASEGEARAMAFATLVISNLSLILTNLSWTRSIISVIRDPNRAMWWVVGGAFGVLLAVLYVPFLRQLFGFGYLHINDLLICLAAGLFSVAWFELLKFVWSKKARGAA